MQQQQQKTASWWPLAAVGLALVAVLTTGCAKCKQCKPGGGGGGGPRAGGGPGPRLDDDGLRGRLEEGFLANDQNRPPGVPRDAFPVVIPTDVPEGPAANQPPRILPGDSPEGLPPDAIPVPAVLSAKPDDVLLLRSPGRAGVVSVRGASGRRPKEEARFEDL